MNLDARALVSSTLGVDVPIALEAGGEPSLTMRLLQPRVRVYVGTNLLTEVAPAGDPDASPPWAGLLVLAVLGLAAYGAFRLARG